MKFTNVAAVIALLAIGACAAGRTDDEISVLADAIVSEFRKPVFDFKNLKLANPNLNNEDIESIRNLPKDVTKDVIVLALNSAEQALNALVKEIVANKNDLNAFKNPRITDNHKFVLISTKKWEKDLDNDNVLKVLNSDDAEIKKMIADFKNRDIRRAKLENSGWSFGEMARMLDENYGELKQLLTEGEIVKFKNLVANNVVGDAANISTFSDQIVESAAEKSKREKETVELIKVEIGRASSAKNAFDELSKSNSIFLSKEQVDRIFKLKEKNELTEDKIRAIAFPPSSSWFSWGNLATAAVFTAVVGCIGYTAYYFTTQKDEESTDL